MSKVNAVGHRYNLDNDFDDCDVNNDDFDDYDKNNDAFDNYDLNSNYFDDMIY